MKPIVTIPTNHLVHMAFAGLVGWVIIGSIVWWLFR